MAYLFHDMTDDERAFVEGILAAADDDAPRLIYADWLDEHDQPEPAELIRDQCAMAATDELPEDWLRYQQLKCRATAAVNCLPRPLGAYVEFVRGMPECLYLASRSDQDRRLRRLCAELPILALDLEGGDDLPVTFPSPVERIAAVGPVRGRVMERLATPVRSGAPSSLVTSSH